MSFLVITKSPKVWKKKVEKIELGSIELEMVNYLKTFTAWHNSQFM